MLPEVILSTKFFNSEIRNGQLEARDIPPTRRYLWNEWTYLHAWSYSES